MCVRGIQFVCVSFPSDSVLFFVSHFIQNCFSVKHV
jgi:hypothetical protein